MASKSNAAKVFGTMMLSFARSCPKSGRIVNVNNRNRLLNQSAKLLSQGIHLMQRRSISAIQTENNFPSSNSRTESSSNETQIDQSNSLKLDDEHKRETLAEKVKKAMSSDLPFGRVFAVVHIGGKQFKITSNDIIMIHKVAAKCGDKIRLRKILAVGGREFTLIGKPLLSYDHVYIEATVLEKTKGRNAIVFKKKRRKNYKRWREHRQDITVLRINKIVINPEIIEQRTGLLL